MLPTGASLKRKKSAAKNENSLTEEERKKERLEKKGKNESLQELDKTSG